MIRVIMGKKGTGKTKQMIDMINEAVQSEHGNVVCIEKGSKLTFDIHYQIRLVDSSEYDVANFTALKGFISGLHAGNYDITHIFIDSLTKIVPTDGYNDVEDFLNWLNNFGEKNGIRTGSTTSARRTASSSPSPSATSPTWPPRASSSISDSRKKKASASLEADAFICPVFGTVFVFFPHTPLTSVEMGGIIVL